MILFLKYARMAKIVFIGDSIAEYKDKVSGEEAKGQYENDSQVTKVMKEVEKF